MATDLANISIASLVRSIESVENELGTALRSKQAALAAKDATFNQLEDVKEAANKREIEMEERLAALQKETEQAQAQVGFGRLSFGVLHCRTADWIHSLDFKILKSATGRRPFVGCNSVQDAQS